MAVQNPATPYWLFLALALLCGFGGGNFASSMANISFFFPKAEKGNALALNAGLGNLGVSVVQFVVPLVITAGVFGWLGGEPIMVKEAGRSVPIWLQNAGFIWVPFIVASAFAAWFGMNDIASAKASFAEQAVIFQRKHNWIMCWLYTGTFGSFIGYSAGFPLLAKTQFPEVNALPTPSSVRWSARCRARSPAGCRTSTAAAASPSGCSSGWPSASSASSTSSASAAGPASSPCSWSCSSSAASAMPPPSR